MAFLLGLGSIGTWTVWEMQQMLIVKHKQVLDAAADQLPTEIDAPGDSARFEAIAQTAIDEYSSDSIQIWFKRADGVVLAESSTLPETSNRIELISFPQVPNEPTIAQLNSQYWVLCRRSLQANGDLVGWFYLAQDITHDYVVLSTLVRSLRFATILTLATLGVMVALFIWRSLHPLRKVSQMAGTTPINGLSLPDMELDQVPSEVKELVQTLGKLSDRLSEAGEQQRQFTNSISHELRTSLCLVYGYLQSTLKRGANLTDPQKEALEIAVSETERTIQLLKNLLDLARIESGAMEFHLEVLILEDVVATAIEKVEKFGHSFIQVEATTHPVTVKADREQLSQVLVHLLDNAVRYSDNGQPVTVKLSQTDDDWTTIQICDRGCGIAQTQHSRIFDPFYRVDPSRSRLTGGVGLGLSIVKSLVAGMNGRIAVRSEPGKGSTFTVTLPSK